MQFTIRHNLLDFVHLGQIARKIGSEKLRCIMTLEPTGLIAYPGVTGGVRLIECVLGEFLPVLPYLVKRLLRMPVCHTSGHKLVLQRHKGLYLLLSHRLSQRIGLTLGEAGQFLRKKHHLLLIHGDTVSVVQILLHIREVVFYRLDAKFSVYEIRNVIHRTRTVQRIHRDQILEPLGMKLLKICLHTRRFELEHHGGVTASVKLISGLVVYRYGLYVYLPAVPVFYVVESLVYDGQGVKPQKVHLQHPDGLDIVTVILRCPHVLSGLLILGQTDWHMLHQIRRSDYRGAGVLPHLAYAALKLTGVFQNLLIDFRPVLQFVLEVWHQTVAVLKINLDVHVLLTRLKSTHHPVDFLLHHLESRLEFVEFRVERILLLLLLAQTVRNHIGKACTLAYRDIAYPGHVLDGAFRRHSSESNHPGHVFGPVSLLHIFVRCGKVLEVHVYIRHIYTVRIKEPFEQELVLDRVQVSNPQTVRHY